MSPCPTIIHCPFKVVHTNGHDEVVARAANLIIGWAAYETARSLFPDDRIDYRDGARIIARSDQAPPDGD
jgi:hypothetical protein